MWDIKNVASQHGRIVIITGANSGIGYETALALAQKDATIVMACRDLKSAATAMSKIKTIYSKAQITCMEIDLSSLQSVRNFVETFKNNFDRLDLLINNAGIMMSPYKLTDDGFENQLATNFIGHFALTGLLMQLLLHTANSRVITLSSLSFKWAPINFDDLHFSKKYDRKKAYGQSKRACLVFAYELNKRLSESNANTISIAAHPGLSKTNLDRYFPSLIRPLGILFLQNQKKGALPILFASLQSELKGGEYIGPDGFGEMRGNPTVVDSDDATKNRDIAHRLWEVAEKITGVHYIFD